MKEAISSAICTYTMLTILAFSVVGCTPDTAEQSKVVTESAARSLQESITGVSKDVLTALGPHAETLKNMSTDEVMKLFRWSYKVVEVPVSSDGTILENQLNDLGRENWECFSIVPTGQLIRITCKKRPMSAVNYLQYIPGM